MGKTERIGLVVTPTEKAAVIKLADHEGGLSQAALIRRLIRKSARENGIWPFTGQSHQKSQPHGGMSYEP